MGIRLRALIKSSIDEFLSLLLKLKAGTSREVMFSSTLMDIQRCYLRLVTLLSKRRDGGACVLERMDSVGDTTRYRVGNFELLHNIQHGVLSVSTGSASINSRVLCSVRSLPLSEQLSRAAEVLGMYTSHEKSNCDICGEYSTVPGLGIPVGRTAEEDFVLVYHPGCRMESHNRPE